MNIITIVLVAWALYSAYLIWKLYDRVDEHDEQIISLAESIVKIGNTKGDDIDKLRDRVGELADKFDACDELIKATEEYTKEAANREKAWAEGIGNVFNYDAMSAIRDTGANK